jgi:hypothetical protein
VEAGDAVNIAVIVQGGETENLSISNSIGITAHGQGTDNLDITNAPDWYAFGMVHLSDVEETGLTHFTVTNVGDVDMDIAIYGTDMTGDVIPRIWTLSDNATPDYQTYGLLAGIPSGEGILGGLGGDEWATVGESGGDEWTELGEGGDYTIVIKKTPSYNILVYTLSPGESLEWGFEALFPTSGLGNEDMAGHVILGATKSTP